MGMNTAAIILNDYSKNLTENPQALSNELRAVLASDRGGSVRGQAMKVLPSKHSSEVTLYVMTGGTLTEITEENLESMNWFRERATKLLKELGFVPQTKTRG